MKCGIVPSSSLTFGWETGVQLFAYEHNIKIDSKEKYQQVKELIELLRKIEGLYSIKIRVTQHITAARKRRDELKLSLGWERKEKS